MSESDRFGLLKFIGASHNLSEVRRLTQKQRALIAKKNLYKLIKLTNGLPMNREVRGDLAGGWRKKAVSLPAPKKNLFYKS